MQEIPLSNSDVSAIAMTMYDLGMLIPNSETVPEQPEPIPGRETDCDLAVLGMPVVNVDEAISAYVSAFWTRQAWHPQNPTGIGWHKLRTTNWIIGVPEASAALDTLDHADANGTQVAGRVQERFAEWKAKPELWDAWIALLRHAVNAERPVVMSAPDYEGPWAIAELLDAEDYRACA
ncbi:hypothetical protein ACIBBE_24015 [Streptomyces sp. NPDC051644]|uniref:hypothetical protein n=1 Tax=Streptomyces sp. NPDC051644 TaxID=3365666 RepID=UPI00378E08A8